VAASNSADVADPLSFLARGRSYLRVLNAKLSSCSTTERGLGKEQLVAIYAGMTIWPRAPNRRVVSPKGFLRRQEWSGATGLMVASVEQICATNGVVMVLATVFEAAE
jgi:hypothetical protein